MIANAETLRVIRQWVEKAENDLKTAEAKRAARIARRVRKQVRALLPPVSLKRG